MLFIGASAKKCKWFIVLHFAAKNIVRQILFSFANFLHFCVNICGFNLLWHYHIWKLRKSTIMQYTFFKLFLYISLFLSPDVSIASLLYRKFVLVSSFTCLHFTVSIWGYRTRELALLTHVGPLTIDNLIWRYIKAFDYIDSRAEQKRLFSK